MSASGSQISNLKSQRVVDHFVAAVLWSRWEPRPTPTGICLALELAWASECGHPWVCKSDLQRLLRAKRQQLLDAIRECLKEGVVLVRDVSNDPMVGEVRLNCDLGSWIGLQFQPLLRFEHGLYSDLAGGSSLVDRSGVSPVGASPGSVVAARAIAEPGLASYRGSPGAAAMASAAAAAGANVQDVTFSRSDVSTIKRSERYVTLSASATEAECRDAVRALVSERDYRLYIGRASYDHVFQEDRALLIRAYTDLVSRIAEGIPIRTNNGKALWHQFQVERDARNMRMARGATQAPTEGHR